jgi:small ligand-binding sensory domain FIST
MRSGGLERADAALVFATTRHGPGFTRTTRTVSEVCGTREVSGCSAAGVLAAETEVEGGPGVAVLALQGDLRARRFFVPTAPGADRVAEDVAAAVEAAGGPARLVLLFTDSYNVDAPGVLAALARRLPDVPVVGGGASEDGSVGEVSVFAGDASSSHAVAGLALGGPLAARVGVTHAVRRVGPVRRVTGARGNVVHTLDGEPAYAAFTSVVPEPLREDLRRAVAVVLVGLPVGGEQFVTRHLVGIDPARGALAVAAPIREGQELFFAVRDPQAARADIQRLLAGEAAAWQDAAAGALYVNCVGRGRGLHGVPGLDTAYIRQHLGGLPVAGFFSGAEIAPGGGTAQLHQYTGVLVTLGSRE